MNHADQVRTAERPAAQAELLPATAAQEAETRRRLKQLAHMLDTAIPLPGGFRIGFDGIIGLVPGIGDLTGAALSSYIIMEAHRLGTPRIVLLRMLLNVMVETIIGAIPVAGDLFDFIWKANRRNVVLLERHLDQPHRVRRQSTWIIAVILGSLVLLTVAVVALLVALLRWIVAAL
jgi:hypothetical protein